MLHDLLRVCLRGIAVVDMIAVVTGWGLPVGVEVYERERKRKQKKKRGKEKVVLRG